MYKLLGPHLAAAAAGHCWKGLWSQDWGLGAGLLGCAAGTAGTWLWIKASQAHLGKALESRSSQAQPDLVVRPYLLSSLDMALILGCCAD